PMEPVLAFSHSGSRARRLRARTLLSLAALVSVVPVTLLAVTPAASSQLDPAAPARDRLARAQADAAAAQTRYDQAVADRDQAQWQGIELGQAVATARAEEAAGPQGGGNPGVA